MLVVGLTGGMGSGKSTVAKCFAELGVPVIDADVVARLVVELNTPAYHEILAHFGHRILEISGQIDRSLLRSLIFANANERQWLEKLLHPLILTEMKRQIAALQAPLCIVVIPLLVETLPHPYLDRILVVDAEPMDQISRAAARDQLTLEEVDSILNTQATREQRLAVADDVLLNNDTLSALKAKVKALHATYSTIANKVV